MNISEATNKILTDEILAAKPGSRIYSSWIRGRANKAAAFRIANSQGFIKADPMSRPDWKVWVRTDKDASEFDTNPPVKSRGKRGPNRRRFLNAAKNGTLQAKCNGRYTDDYQWDAATNFGKTVWFDVVLGQNMDE